MKELMLLKEIVCDVNSVVESYDEYCVHVDRV
jgi:hypothetical protein